MKETPETDAQIERVENLYNDIVCSPSTAVTEVVPAEFARKLELERDEARGSNARCNTAWLETLERSNCYLTTGGKIVQRNEDRDQLHHIKQKKTK